VNGGASDAPARVLLVAPTGRDAALAAAALREGAVEVSICRDLAGAIAALPGGAAALLLAQEAVEPRGASALAEAIARQPAWSDLPIIVFTAPSAIVDPAWALDRLGPLGNVTLLGRPLRRATLVTVVRSAIRARRRQYAARDVLLELEREVAARDRFLAMLGHELRNPLFAVTTALEVIERRGAGGLRELEIIGRQSRQLARIVDDLLDMARITSGKVALHRVPLDLAALAAKALEALRPQAARAGIALALAGTPLGLVVDGDPVRLEQVLANLVGNALKFTPTGGHVWVSVAPEGSEAVLRVRDDGPGIPPDQLRRVFDTFAQLEATVERSRGGLGLGLTVARSLAAMHGGTIEAFSEGAGTGSEFVVRLPLAPEVADGRPPAAETPVEGRPRRVLVIEDGEDNRAAVRSALEQMGHEVLEAADGVAGAESAIRNAPEVVVVDIGLPGLDGYEVARRIRSARGGRVVLVALTGYGQPEDRRAALSAGFDVHLTKPVELAALAAAIARTG
jgi:signal transduction histidine kinase